MMISGDDDVGALPFVRPRSVRAKLKVSSLSSSTTGLGARVVSLEESLFLTQIICRLKSHITYAFNFAKSRFCSPPVHDPVDAVTGVQVDVWPHQ